MNRIEAVLEEPGPDGEPTIAEWLATAVAALITEAEGFSGKRPVGNSGWWDAFDAALSAHDVDEADLIEEVTRRLTNGEST